MYQPFLKEEQVLFRKTSPIPLREKLWCHKLTTPYILGYLLVSLSQEIDDCAEMHWKRNDLNLHVLLPWISNEWSQGYKLVDLLIASRVCPMRAISHVWHENIESSQTYEFVDLLIAFRVWLMNGMSHVWRENESYEGAIWLIDFPVHPINRVTRMKELWHTKEWVMPRAWRSNGR